MIQKKLFLAILLGIITVASPVSAAQTVDGTVKSENAAAKDTKVGRVLYINSYDRGYKWSNDIERGLVERFRNADRKIELSVEYLDGRRFPGTARNDLLAATLAAKYAGYRHDIVVVSDNFAFDFAIQYRKQLFPGLPIVFCGYNNFRPDVLKGISNITGVNEEVDFAKTVELAIRIQPAVRNLVFITSTGDDSNRRMAEVTEAALFPELRKDYNVIVLKDASMAEIGARLGTLSPDSAVFLVGMTSDLIEGRRPTAVENGCMILAVSPAPVYSFWDFALGTGILGGYIIAGRDQGRTAADMVLRILDGTSADSIPVMIQTPARTIIDFNVIKKFGIKVNDLPEGCAFINRPVSLWEIYGWYIGAALLALFLESLLIVALVLSLRQRKEAFRMLGIERDLLEQRVEERTVELQRANELLEVEIRVRTRTERIITARLRLLEFAATHSLDELLEATINEAEALTGSSIGFYHFLESDQKTLCLQNWSTRTKAEFCRAECKGPHYNVSQASIWTDCIHQRKPVIHNDHASLPRRKGMPPDHPEVIRELALPVFRGDSIVAIIGVGNKPHDYTAEDIEAVSFLADLGWEIAERKQAEEALHLSLFCIDKAGIGIYQSDENGTIFSVNEHACNSLGYSRDELCALTIFNIDPEITPERMLALKELLDETGSATHYTTHRRKDGSTFPVEITANTIDFRGKRYGISFVKDITERKRMEEELRESESRVRRKLESILDPEGDIGELELADIIDAPAMQALVEDLHRVSGLPISITDIKEKLIVGVGWQEICTKFHRGHPETLKRCIESDTAMTEGIAQGEFKQYRCRNNMRHLVAPIMVAGKHLGTLFVGQFFFENDELDYGLFRAQARQFGFPEEEYISALKAVPRHNEEFVNKGKAFFLRLIDMFSRLSYGNIKLARLLAERERLTETLRQANLVVEHSPVVLFRWKGDDEWPVELVSKNVVQFGYEPEEFLSRAITYSAIIHPDDLQRVTREVHDICNGGGDLLRLEYRIITKGGDVRWVNELTNVERDEAGGIRNFEGVVIDITERKLAEEAIRESKAKYQAIVNNFDGYIYVCSQDYRIEFMNVRLIERTGYDATGESCYRMMHDRDSACPWCVNERVFAGETLHREMLSPKDNRWYHVVNVPIRHADGSMSKQSMMIDVTGRKQADEELRKATMVVENSPVVLFRCKAASGWPVELVSRNVVQFGYEPEEFLSGELTYASIVHPHDLGKVIAETETHSAKGKDQWVQEYRIVTRDGDIRWIVDEKVCERNEDGEITHYEGVIIDITERRRAEEQLIAQQIQLRELNSTLEERVQAEVRKNREKDVMLIQQNRQAALGEILDHIAHQWKHPLSTISLTAYLLNTDDKLNEDSVRQATDSIIDQVSALTQMLNDYRDFYRPDKEKSVFRIKEGIDKALSFIMPVLSIESLELKVNVDPCLSALGYPKEFSQVILNLVSNARDAFKVRKVQAPMIVVKGFAEDEMAVVTVTDNAGGISEAVLDSIFKMNFTTKEHIGGTGIGLYMSRNIIERDMEGNLTAANVDHGAQFCIRLPIAETVGKPAA